ncbi:carbon-nitrogen hydrolase family protein [Agrobacterium vitis]|uniref:carbon-nitrogen hydrolase family protein n=1 Tax=Agrobacterium vitis TaxID=373 RepID=UPI0008DC1872|nr:carbon-nitrogen hydrolase family protein [Agrobacterium vitis]MUO85256.1 carbon-nitrogen hydrolase family protein [Agrobacterium vitis]
MVTACAVEWPDGLVVGTEQWCTCADAVSRVAPDILITNEMPFGAWLPKALPYDHARAEAWAELHAQSLAALGELAPAVISSRPVVHGGRLANEAFALEAGVYRVLHHKHLFPAEEGWQEDGWFAPAIPGFDTHVIAGLTVGVLLCTELMFPERARALGRQGAHLIAVPRASGRSMSYWRTAGAMAAIVSGAYVLSSNRVGSAEGTPPKFGGGGFAFDPSARPVGDTGPDHPALLVSIDPNAADAAKMAYPVYVRDRAF